MKAEKPASKELQQAAKSEVSGKDKVLALITGLRADPAFRVLTKRERLDRVKIEIDQLLANGTVQKTDVKAAWTHLATERKAADQARLEQGLPLPARRLAEAKPRAKPLSPEQKDKVRDAVAQLTDAERAELQVLRQKRRDAAPEERRAIQGEIRAFWQRVGINPTVENASSTPP